MFIEKLCKHVCIFSIWVYSFDEQPLTSAKAAAAARHTLLLPIARRKI
jgi:hypothetical protein